MQFVFDVNVCGVIVINVNGFERLSTVEPLISNTQSP